MQGIFGSFRVHVGKKEYRKREEWLTTQNLRPHIIEAAKRYAETLKLDDEFSQSRERIDTALAKLNS